VLAAKILGHTGDITRFATASHDASYTGTAPIEASSGDVRRHRLWRAGNRSLNNVSDSAAARREVKDPPPKLRWIAPSSYAVLRVARQHDIQLIQLHETPDTLEIRLEGPRRRFVGAPVATGSVGAATSPP
jgi:hypothetical protein